MTETVEQVIVRYRPLICKVARTVPPADYDDAVVDGMVGVWEAFSQWDSTQASLNTHVQNKVRWAILEGQRGRTRSKRVTQVDLVRLNGYDVTAASWDDPERRAIVSAAVRTVRQTLTDDDRALFDGLIAGRTQQDIAVEQGVTISRVCQRVRGIRELLQTHI